MKKELKSKNKNKAAGERGFLAVIDYGMGNLHSVTKALERVGVPYRLTCVPGVIRKSSGIILPGVGAFGDAMREIRKRGLLGLIRREAASGKPLMGICLGMQLLFDRSMEFGEHKGLGLIPGEVKRFKKGEKVPQIGWNRAAIRDKKNPLLKGVADKEYYYFVHSYYCEPGNAQNALMETVYGGKKYASAACSGRVCGFQFHPEKSGEKALVIYRNFYEVCGSVKKPL